MKIKKSVNVTKKDAVNMRASSLSLKDCVGQSITVKGAAVCEDTDESGETVEKGFIVAENGDVAGTLSPTAIRTIGDVIDLITDEPNEAVVVNVAMKKSKSDRDFLVLTVQ